jgi:hypothetical protein
LRPRAGSWLCGIALVALSACSGSTHSTGESAVAPTITTQPTSQTVTAGQTATFSVLASGTAPLSYQWQNAATNANISGATSSSYSIPNTTTSESGMQFRVVVSNGVSPAATSNTVTLTVNAASAAPTITTQPTSQTVTAGQTATFSVAASGTSPLSYQWQNAATNANISGATSSSYSIPNTTTSESGMQFRVVVSNGVSPAATSNTVTLTVNPAQNASSVSVLTYHNDVSRSGLNPNETILTPSNVNSNQFGLLGTIAVDGPVDAEPLYVGGITISGATHNVLVVSTESDSVYAFDADTFTQLWHNALLTGTGESPSDDRGCSQVEPTIGVTSTPVIDLTAGPHGTIFLVAMSKSGGTYYQRLHALDLTTGVDRMTATDIQASFPNSGGTTTFDPEQYEERSGLLLMNGTVYLAWTSHCDGGPYNAWVMGYSESSLAQVSAINLTPNGGGGGIWMAGDGLAADSSGNIYFLDGNGTFDTTLNSGFPSSNDYGNAFIKLSTANSTLSVADYFAEFDTVSQSNNDQDLGSGGVLLLPDMTDASGNTHHLAVGAGKADLTRSGNPVMLYVVDRDNMGKFNASSDSVYQELSGALLGGSGNGVWSAPAYFNNTLYYGAVNDTLKAFAITNAQVASAASSHSSNTFGYPGTTPSISANGSTDGIVWAVENGGGANLLYAYDATNLNTALFSGAFSGSSTTKFVTPLIANGKVYVGTGSPNSNTPGTVAVFGLTTQGARLIAKPSATPRRHRWEKPRPPRPGSSTPGL